MHLDEHAQNSTAMEFQLHIPGQSNIQMKMYEILSNNNNNTERFILSKSLVFFPTILALRFSSSPIIYFVVLYC